MHLEGIVVAAHVESLSPGVYAAKVPWRWGESSCKLARGGPRRAVFARWGWLWEFEGSEARGQGNRGIKSEDGPQGRAKTNVFAKIGGSNVRKRRI